MQPGPILFWTLQLQWLTSFPAIDPAPKTKLEQITDPTLPSSKGDLQAAIDELTEIATTVHDLDRWKASLANLVKKTIVILPNINTELEGILANLTPAKPQEGNNLHLLFKKLQRHFSGNENS